MSEERKVLSFISHPISYLEFSVRCGDSSKVVAGHISARYNYVTVVAVKSGEEWYHLERVFVKDLAWYKFIENNDSAFMCVDAEEEL